MGRTVTMSPLGVLAPRFAQIAIDNVDDAILLLAGRGAGLSIEYVNRGFLRIFGYTVEEIIGRPVGVLAGDDRSDLLRIDFDADNPHRAEGLLRTKSGSDVLVEVEMQMVELTDATAVLVVLRDVTEYRRLEHIAAATVVSESVGRVFAGIRHELGNPINSLKAALTLLSDPVAVLPAERRADYFRRALGEVARMEALLNQFRTFNQNESVRLEHVNIRSFLERFNRLACEDVAGRGATLEIETDREHDSATIQADPRLLHQILLILLANALDAVEDSAVRRIRVGWSEGARITRVTLTDSGIGMNAEQLENALRPFVTSKPRGTGLGLPLATRYAALMKCGLELSSEPGVGTRCTLTFSRTTA